MRGTIFQSRTLQVEVTLGNLDIDIGVTRSQESRVKSQEFRVSTSLAAPLDILHVFNRIVEDGAIFKINKTKIIL